MAPKKAWARTKVPCDEADKLLFITHHFLGQQQSDLLELRLDPRLKAQGHSAIFLRPNEEEKRLIALAIHNDNWI
jgi:hypothetical protein